MKFHVFRRLPANKWASFRLNLQWLHSTDIFLNCLKFAKLMAHRKKCELIFLENYASLMLLTTLSIFFKNSCSGVWLLCKQVSSPSTHAFWFLRAFLCESFWINHWYHENELPKYYKSSRLSWSHKWFSCHRSCTTGTKVSQSRF